MELNIGDSVQTNDCHGQPVSGEISQLLERTVIVTEKEQRFVVAKKVLRQEGYTFPPFNKKILTSIPITQEQAPSDSHNWM